MIGSRIAGPPAARRLLAHDRAARNWLALAVVADVAAVMALLGELVAVALAVNGVFLEGQELGAVTPLLVTGLVLLLVRALLGGTSAFASHRSAQRLAGTLRADVTAQLLRLGPVWSSRQHSGDIVGVLIGGIQAIEDYVTGFLPARWLALVVPLLVLGLVLVLDPPSVLVLLLTGPLLLLLLAVIGGRTRVITERRFLEMRALSAFFLDILRGIATLKLFGRSREQTANLRRISDRYGDTTMDVLRTAFQTSLVLEWGAAIATALVAVEVGLRLLEDGIAFDRALAVLLVVPEFFLPLRRLAIRFHVGTTGAAAIARTFEILDEPRPAGAAAAADIADDADALDRGRPPTPPPPTPPPTSSPRPTPPPTSSPRVTLRQVGFSYVGRDVPALRAVDLELAAGTCTALVGDSGAGKSTVAGLLLRFMEPDQGVIEVDGAPLASIQRSAWRDALAWVPQRPHLFDGSVAANIRLGRPDADDDAVRAAAAAADAAGFIERLAQGYETSVGEGGSRLSGGQRQRLAIARAFLRDAPLLIFDEATSYQDEASEAAIADVVGRLMRGRTVLVIAHRLRLARTADQVVVLRAGQVVEAGTPDGLLAADGAYRRLLEDHERSGSTT